jgi:hypothetical protein
MRRCRKHSDSLGATGGESTGKSGRIDERRTVDTLPGRVSEFFLPFLPRHTWCFTSPHIRTSLTENVKTLRTTLAKLEDVSIYIPSDPVSALVHIYMKNPPEVFNVGVISFSCPRSLAERVIKTPCANASSTTSCSIQRPLPRRRWKRLRRC